MREGISQYVWGVSHCERLYTIVGGHAHAYMIRVCQGGCTHDGNTSASVFVAGCFKHVAKVYVAEMS